MHNFSKVYFIFSVGEFFLCMWPTLRCHWCKKQQHCSTRRPISRFWSIFSFFFFFFWCYDSIMIWCFLCLVQLFSQIQTLFRHHCFCLSYKVLREWQWDLRNHSEADGLSVSKGDIQTVQTNWDIIEILHKNHFNFSYHITHTPISVSPAGGLTYCAHFGLMGETGNSQEPKHAQFGNPAWDLLAMGQKC